jgi:hypothetical protein
LHCVRNPTPDGRLVNGADRRVNQHAAEYGRFGDLNACLGDFRSNVDNRFSETNRRIEELDKKMDQRFDDMKSTWRS